MNESTAIKIMIETEESLIGDFIEKLVEESKKHPIDYHRISILSGAIARSVVKRKHYKIFKRLANVLTTCAQITERYMERNS